ncbi:AGE family epimerase/isomerase [Portibacter marinus]|uniref:AGE family epimerase/isomerase n=1 Tax=Portibacter marinus TaxID=2898660 RepID=UPI001F1D55C1|nr:AGE family epimerase/isomerase [Portibacter marinus]
MNTSPKPDSLNFKSLAAEYKHELLDQVIPFWEKHSIDHEYGGYFTCLDRYGQVFDTDKFIWLQARQVYTFAKLYLEVEEKSEWLKWAQHGATFLMNHGRNEAGEWYFALDQKGQPQVHAYNIFSDCFAALAFGTLYKADSKDIYKEIAVHTFNQILQRQKNPKKHYNKHHPLGRSMQNFALPMIISNLSKELSHIIDVKTARSLEEEIIETVMEKFYNPELDLILENVGSDGSFVDSFEGRLINPGHAIEAMWFMMDLGKARNDLHLVQRAFDRAIRMMEYGWDHKYGGIFYFMDCQGHPTQQLEWDQKLWWPHLEALVCLAKGMEYLNDQRAKEWFTKIHHYTWTRFRDEEYMEWYGYLNRRGELLLNLKGGKWKGCFHVPRSLLIIAQSLEQYITQTTA